MLLLTAVTFGGSECPSALDHLPPDEAELLQFRAAEMLQIPREKRIPLLVQEIKRLVKTQRRMLNSADPERLAVVLSKERGALQQVVLRALPASIAEGARALLQRRELSLKKEVKPEILNIVRWKLEELLARDVPRHGVFKFTDILLLHARELVTLCDRMGARALATAIAGLPEEERKAFFDALSPDQRTLAMRASEAGADRRLNVDDAKTILSLYDAQKRPSTGMRSAGVQRLARACLAQSPEFAARMLERQSGEIGKLLAKWVREERHRPIRGDGGRADMVEQLERLAQKGVVERPLRLPPPPKRPVPPMPAGRLLAPPPKSVGERAAQRLPPPPAKGPGGVIAPPPPRRDPIAERAAKRAGAVGRGGPSERRRDPIAEREARRAGAFVAPRPPEPSTDPERSVVPRRILREGPDGQWDNADTLPPQGKAQLSPVLTRPPQRKAGVIAGTVVSRPPRPTGSKAVLKGPNRGPKDGSG